MSVLASPEYVNAGARMTWTGQFSFGANSLGNELLASSPYDAVANIGAYLKNHYQIIIERTDNGVSWFSKSGKVTLYLRSDMDRGDGETDDGLTDIGGNVRDAFNAQGFPCLSFAITDYTNGSTDGTTSNQSVTTATKQTTVATDAATATKGGSFLDSIGLGSLGTNLAVGGAGLLIGGVVALGVIIFVMLQPRPSVAV